MGTKIQEFRLKRISLYCYHVQHATSFYRPLLLFIGHTDFHGNVNFTVMVET